MEAHYNKKHKILKVKNLTNKMVESRAPESHVHTKEEKEEICEECGHKDILVSAIVNGKLKRICHRCVIANNAIVIKKPKEIAIKEPQRKSVKEILNEMSGIKGTRIVPKLKKPSNEVTLEDLRERYKKIKEKEEGKEQKTAQFQISTPQTSQTSQNQNENAQENQEEEKIKSRLQSEPQSETTGTKKSIISKDVKEAYERLREKRRQEAEKRKRIIENLKKEEKEEKENRRDETTISFDKKTIRHTRIRDLLEKMKALEEMNEVEEKVVEKEKKIEEEPEQAEQSQDVEQSQDIEDIEGIENEGIEKEQVQNTEENNESNEQ